MLLLDVAGEQEPVRARSTPSSTIETLLMPVPPSGGSIGASPAAGQSTVMRDLVDREAVAGDQADVAPGRRGGRAASSQAA